MKRVNRASFATGCLSLFIKAPEYNESYCNNVLGQDSDFTTEDVIEGEVNLRLQMPTYVRGVWVKLAGINKVALSTTAGSSSVKNITRGVVSVDLLKSDEHHHIDGIHEVFVGFGEEDSSEGNYLELPPGKHTWTFAFTLPADAPLTYIDDRCVISYTLSAVLDSPIVATDDSRLRIRHEVLRRYSRDNNQQLVRMNLNNLVLRPGNLIESAATLRNTRVDTTRVSGGGFFGRILQNVIPNRQRDKNNLSLLSSAPKLRITGAGRSDAAFAPAILSFQSQQQQYKVNCSVVNCGDVAQLVAFAELFVELSYRSDPSIPFAERCTTTGSITGKSATAAICGDAKYYGLPYEELIPTTSGCCRCFSLWKQCKALKTNENSQVEFSLNVPVKIDADTRSQLLGTSALNHRQPSGKIMHFTMEAPLFRYRVILQVSVLKLDQTLLCAPACGEIYVLPPTTNPAVATATTTSVAITAAVDVTTESIVQVPVVPCRPRPPSCSRGAAAFSPRNRTNNNSNNINSSSNINSNSSSNSSSCTPRSEEVMQPSPVGTTGGNSSSVAASAFAGFTAAVRMNTETTDASVESSADNPFTTPRNCGSNSAVVKTPRAPVAAATTTAAAAATTTGVRTPCARPTRSKFVVRVDAEPITKGPAAAVIDRNERNRDPINTPQRFVEMFNIGEATVVDGSPICAVIDTPIGPGIRAMEEETNDNDNDNSRVANAEDLLQHLAYAVTPRVDSTTAARAAIVGSPRTAEAVIAFAVDENEFRVVPQQQQQQQIVTTTAATARSITERITTTQINVPAPAQQANLLECPSNRRIYQSAVSMTDNNHCALISCSTFNSSIVLANTHETLGPLIVQ